MKLKDKIKRFWTLDVHNHEGFTLVELIIVIAILAILSAVAVVGYSAYVEKANKSADEALIYEINQAFRAACIENYLDVYEVQDAKAEIKNGTVEVSNVKVNGAVNADIAEDFATYFSVSNPVLKYYKAIAFDKDNHVFYGSMESDIDRAKALLEAWGLSSFADDEEVVMTLLEAFDGIGGFFREAGGYNLEAWLLNNVSGSLADAMGLNGMLDGFESAIDITDEQLDAYLEKFNPTYAALDEEERAAWRANPDNEETIKTIKGNLGVLHFASDAANRDIDSLMSSVDNYLDVLAAKNDSDKIADLTDADYEEYYKKTLSEEELEVFMSKSADERKAEVDANFRYRNGPEVQLGDLSLDAGQLVYMDKVAAGGENTAGASSLGALYALAAGYLNSSYGAQAKVYYEQMGLSLTDFGTCMMVMDAPNFQEYYEAQGQADLEAYLAFMGYLSENPDVDLTNPNAFAGQEGYINGALGNGN